MRSIKSLFLLMVLCLISVLAYGKYGYKIYSTTISSDAATTLTVASSEALNGKLARIYLRFPKSDGSCHLIIEDATTGVRIVDSTTSGTCATITKANISSTEPLKGTYNIYAGVDNHASATETEVMLKLIYEED